MPRRSSLLPSLAVVLLALHAPAVAVASDASHRPRQSASPSPSREAALDATCELRPIHFAHDSAWLTPSARRDLRYDARCLVARGCTRVELVGHSSPRGTEEYNLTYAERIALSVRRYLERVLGPSAGIRFTAVGRGEEEATGVEREGWARDRRVDLVCE